MRQEGQRWLLVTSLIAGSLTCSLDDRIKEWQLQALGQEWLVGHSNDPLVHDGSVPAGAIAVVQEVALLSDALSATTTQQQPSSIIGRRA
mgnify:CR=1 FL=1